MISESELAATRTEFECARLEAASALEAATRYAVEAVGSIASVESVRRLETNAAIAQEAHEAFERAGAKYQVAMGLYLAAREVRDSGKGDTA